MVNKRGWLRIMETVIAIMILGSVILIVFNRQVPDASSADYINKIQKENLRNILSNSTLYGYALGGNESALNDFVKASVFDTRLNHSIRVCNLTSPVTFCDLEDYILNDLIGKDIYVNDVIVSANLSVYNPSKVRIFTWINDF